MELANTIVLLPSLYLNPQNSLHKLNSGQRYLYLTDYAAVVVNKSGELITTYGKDKFGSTTLQILEEAIK